MFLIVDHIKWFKPTKSETGLKQRTSKWLYSDIVQLLENKPKAMVTQQESNVLLELNCVDPMYLIDNQFLREVHDTLLSILDSPERVKIIGLNTGYRLNLSHISDYIE